MKFFLPIILFFFLLNSCANMVAPNGGEKDVNAPKLINTTEIYSKEKNQLQEIY